MASQEEAAAAPAPAASEVVPLVGRHTARYLGERERLAAVGVLRPPLPDPQAPWGQRRVQIGRLADRLFGTWFDWQIARLLNENGVRTNTGCTFSPQLVCYYRRTYGGRAA